MSNQEKMTIDRDWLFANGIHPDGNVRMENNAFLGHYFFWYIENGDGADCLGWGNLHADEIETIQKTSTSPLYLVHSFKSPVRCGETGSISKNDLQEMFDAVILPEDENGQSFVLTVDEKSQARESVIMESCGVEYHQMSRDRAQYAVVILTDPVAA